MPMPCKSKEKSKRRPGPIKGYMPLRGFLFETPLCLQEEFREGNVSPGSGHTEGARPAASYQADLINALEAEGVVWAITGDPDRAGKEPRVARGCTPGPAPTLPFVGSSNGSYAASRICGENQISHGVAGQGPIEEKNALPVWGWHNQRGQAENFLKERKGGFDRMPGALLFPNRGDRLP